MSKIMENVKTINSLVRTIILLGVLAVVGVLGYFGFDKYIRPGFEAQRLKKEFSELQVRFDAQAHELDRVQTALKLLKVDSRKALIRVLEKGADADSGEPYIDVEFIEVDRANQALCDAREFRLRGTMMFVDSWVVKFEDKYVEQAEALRAASLCLFKSIYGDLDGRAQGHSLDRANNDIVTAYGSSSEMSDFERQIWDDFWIVANDPHRRKELGIRANHGEIDYVLVEEGKTYQVDLRSSGGLSLRSIDETEDQ